MKRPLASLILLFFAPLVIADGHELPRLELGVSLGVLDIPNYRGSKNSSTLVIPLPYIKYRGDRLKVDEGIQGIFFDSKDLVVSISGNGTLPVDDDNPERLGMDELDATLEIGPSLDYRLTKGIDQWWIELPLRLAFTLNSEFEHIGQVFQPRLVWRKPARRLYEWKLRAAFGPIYATGEFHDYYYRVNADEVLATRPAYNADAGFSGVRGTFSYSKRFGEFWLGGFVRYDSLSNSVVEDSPLVSDSSAWMAGIAVGWIFSDQY